MSGPLAADDGFRAAHSGLGRRSSVLLGHRSIEQDFTQYPVSLTFGLIVEMACKAHLILCVLGFLLELCLHQTW